jgi:hypothetical protein
MGDRKKIKVKSKNDQKKGSISIKYPSPPGETSKTITLESTDGKRTATLVIEDAKATGSGGGGGDTMAAAGNSMSFQYDGGGQILTITIAE